MNLIVPQNTVKYREPILFVFVMAPPVLPRAATGTLSDVSARSSKTPRTPTKKMPVTGLTRGGSRFGRSSSLSNVDSSLEMIEQTDLIGLDEPSPDSIKVLVCEINKLKEIINNLNVNFIEMKMANDALLVENKKFGQELSQIKDRLPVAGTGMTSSKASFSDILQSKHPVVVVKPKDQTKSVSDTLGELKKTVKPSEMPIGRVRGAAKGGVIVECDTLESTVKVRSKISERLGPEFIVTAPGKRIPKIYIFGMSDELSVGDIESQVRAQNRDVFSDDSIAKVVTSFKVGRSSSFGAKLQLDPASFRKAIMAGRLNVGWDSCVIREAFDLVRCFKCNGFNHMASSCTATRSCSKCSGDHFLSDCISDVAQCVNCLSANKSLKVNLNPNHAASSVDCPVYKRKIEMEKRVTDYGNHD